MDDDVSKLRAEVIERAINIEWLINSVISQHFFGRVRMDFISSVLYDENSSFSLKRSIATKLYPEINQIDQKLRRLGAIRNYFAHVALAIVEGPDPDGPPRVPDPKKFSKSVNFTALHGEFLGIEKEVVGVILDVYKSQGGILVEA